MSYYGIWWAQRAIYICRMYHLFTDPDGIDRLYKPKEGEVTTLFMRAASEYEKVHMDFKANEEIGNMRPTATEMHVLTRVKKVGYEEKNRVGTVAQGSFLSYCAAHTTFSIHHSILSGATSAEIAQAIRAMSAGHHMDKTCDTHYGFACPILVIWNFNELCEGANYSDMKSVQQSKELVDNGCEMICKALLDKGANGNSLLGRHGPNAYRRVTVLVGGRSTIWGMPPEWVDMTHRAISYFHARNIQAQDGTFWWHNLEWGTSPSGYAHWRTAPNEHNRGFLLQAIEAYYNFIMVSMGATYQIRERLKEIKVMPEYLQAYSRYSLRVQELHEKEKAMRNAKRSGSMDPKVYFTQAEYNRFVMMKQETIDFSYHLQLICEESVKILASSRSAEALKLLMITSVENKDIREFFERCYAMALEHARRTKTKVVDPFGRDMSATEYVELHPEVLEKEKKRFPGGVFHEKPPPRKCSIPPPEPRASSDETRGRHAAGGWSTFWWWL
eukprot:2658660-Amphidinium_carterae.1